jgi:uncharacterized protein YacL
MNRKMGFKIFTAFALFEVLLLTLSLRTGMRTEIEFIINCLFLVLITFGFIKYANEGILVEHLNYSLGRISFYAILGLLVGLIVSYFLWMFSQSPIVRDTDWYAGLIVQCFRLGFGVLSILLSIGVIALIRRFNFGT